MKFHGILNGIFGFARGLVVVRMTSWPVEGKKITFFRNRNFYVILENRYRGEKKLFRVEFEMYNKLLMFGHSITSHPVYINLYKLQKDVSYINLNS